MIALLGAGLLCAVAATTNAPDAAPSTPVATNAYPPATSDDPGSDDPAKLRQAARDLYAGWLKELPADRIKNLDDVMKAMVRADDKELAAAIVRGGFDRQHRLALPTDSKQIAVKIRATLPSLKADDDASRYEHGSSTIFRRIDADHFEAWTPTDGWLFDGHGHLIHHAKVPRRDGTGRSWFGAFLPSGMWITTDLWSDDRQLNCFSADDKWLWELRGRDILTKNADNDSAYEDEVPIRWARAAKDGTGWVASVSFYGPHYFFVSSGHQSRTLGPLDPWKLTYPRSMAAKGTYLDLSVPSDDGAAVLEQNSAGHGDWIDYPNYRVDAWPDNVVIPEGDVYFGFWPGTHRTWAETDHVTYDKDGNTASSDRNVWFLGAEGTYEAEISAAWLGDAADHASLLLRDTQQRVIKVTPKLDVTARSFHDGPAQLQPLAFFDDLKLGFFFDPKGSTVVLAGW